MSEPTCPEGTLGRRGLGAGRPGWRERSRRSRGREVETRRRPRGVGGRGRWLGVEPGVGKPRTHRAAPPRTPAGISSAASGGLRPRTGGSWRSCRRLSPRGVPRADGEARGRAGAELPRPLQAGRRARLRAGLLSTQAGSPRRRPAPSGACG